MLLSACLITKNEQARIGPCIDSVRGLADQVVLLDSGSSDATIAIAEQHGAQVHQAPWNGFTHARNRSLELCSGEWILLLDADEIAEVADPAQVRLRLSAALDDVVAHHVRFILRTGLTPYPRLRVVRNDRRFRYQGIIHEVIDRSVLRAVEQGQGTIGNLPLTLRHLGGDDPLAKAERDEPHLRDACRNDPNNAFGLAHLAAILNKIGTPDQADQAWRRAIKSGRRKQSLYQRYDSLAFLGAIERRLTRAESADDWIEEAAALFPDNMTLTWHLARLRIRQDHPQEAASLFEKIIAQNGAPQTTESFGEDQRLFGEAGYDALANCRLQLGQHAEAERCFRQAAANAADPTPYLAKAALCRELG